MAYRYYPYKGNMPESFNANHPLGNKNPQFDLRANQFSELLMQMKEMNKELKQRK